MAKIIGFVTKEVMAIIPYDDDYRAMKELERSGWGEVQWDLDAATEVFVWYDEEDLIKEGHPEDAS